MRASTIIGVFLFAAITVPTTPATGVTRIRMPVRQWAMVEFARTTDVAGVQLNAGRYLIVHDPEKMARGAACTTFYTFGPSGTGPRQEAVSFHCIPRERPIVSRTKLTITTEPGNTYGCTDNWNWTMDKLTEYQFADDPEGHGVPTVEMTEESLTQVPKLSH
jgi:hypothetical protein